MDNEPREITKWEIDAMKSAGKSAQDFIKHKQTPFRGNSTPPMDDILNQRMRFLRWCVQVNERLPNRIREELLPIRPPDLTIRAPWETRHVDEELLEFARQHPEFKDAIDVSPNYMAHAEYFEKLPLLLADFHLEKEWMLISIHMAIINWLYPEIVPLLPGAVAKFEPGTRCEPPQDFTLSVPGLDLIKKPAVGGLTVDMNWPHQESEVRLFMNRVISGAFAHIHEAVGNAQFANIAPLEGKPDTLDTNLKHLALRVVNGWSASTIIEKDMGLSPRNNKNKASDIYSATKKLSKVLAIPIPEASVTISKSR